MFPVLFPDVGLTGPGKGSAMAAAAMASAEHMYLPQLRGHGFYPGQGERD